LDIPFGRKSQPFYWLYANDLSKRCPHKPFRGSTPNLPFDDGKKHIPADAETQPFVSPDGTGIICAHMEKRSFTPFDDGCTEDTHEV
jgi:hypothetical protein